LENGGIGPNRVSNKHCSGATQGKRSEIHGFFSDVGNNLSGTATLGRGSSKAYNLCKNFKDTNFYLIINSNSNSLGSDHFRRMTFVIIQMRFSNQENITETGQTYFENTH